MVLDAYTSPNETPSPSHDDDGDDGQQGDSAPEDAPLTLTPLAAAAHALAPFDPTTLAVANLDDDYWQFIHSDLMSTDALSAASALPYLLDASSTLAQNAAGAGHAAPFTLDEAHHHHQANAANFSLPVKTEPLSPRTLMASTSMTAINDPMMGALFDQSMLPASSFYTATDIKPSLLLGGGQEDMAWLSNMPHGRSIDATRAGDSDDDSCCFPDHSHRDSGSQSTRR
ncbi:hypothetical protein SYNPS1DRAFT_24035 [Syncephalis pseudoplumigaleata]|uniref:Uncharacterized protein n=1 Tax=Syncephalis pseudoplumigaleata TaxID=1712513 RepID=A0A4P9YV51_9FUNG|nr:hypothetical protein SYNPS1DRAFT_24035 [Syncephalis pseudoplumigaleata]|eukprot:RKP23886.1 hypothetical protein SYNPS1DRAFT_24035 [Syncephalis pseudoplumigaleata]